MHDISYSQAFYVLVFNNLNNALAKTAKKELLACRPPTNPLGVPILKFSVQNMKSHTKLHHISKTHAFSRSITIAHTIVVCGLHYLAV